MFYILWFGPKKDLWNVNKLRLYLMAIIYKTRELKLSVFNAPHHEDKRGVEV
jgi:hypothetical protein